MSTLKLKLTKMAYNTNTKMAIFMLEDEPYELFQVMTIAQYVNLRKWIIYDTVYEWTYDKKTRSLIEGPYPVNEDSCCLL